MVPRVRAGASLLTWLVLWTLPACHSRPAALGSGLDAAAGDGSAADVLGTLALDFAATGCGRADAGGTHGGGGVAPCTGTPPLTLTFSPVSSAALTRFLWTFGDGSAPSTERAPTHTYVLPGAYDVALVAEGAVGSVSRQHAQYVQVAAASAGALCDVDAQCAAGLFCLCGQGAGCEDSFRRGVCTSACAAAACGSGAACARVVVPTSTVVPAADAGDDASATDGASDRPNDVASDGRDAAPIDAPSDADAAASDASRAGAGSADASSPADRPANDSGAPSATPTALCLAACSNDAQCDTGLVCRALPGLAGSWASVCVPPYFRNIGDSCRDAQDRLDDGLCSAGLCADLGAVGLCSASCAAGAACPPGSACATFGDGRALCLASCSPSVTCTRDPLLSCQAATGAGLLGFSISPPAPMVTFCAPRSCASQADCAPAGMCAPKAAVAHCVAN
ncbi:MAG TPA: PKD domain-containing protein [Polyangia bacterium]